MLYGFYPLQTCHFRKGMGVVESFHVRNPASSHFPPSPATPVLSFSVIDSRHWEPVLVILEKILPWDFASVAARMAQVSLLFPSFLLQFFVLHFFISSFLLSLASFFFFVPLSTSSLSSRYLLIPLNCPLSPVSTEMARQEPLCAPHPSSSCSYIYDVFIHSLDAPSSPKSASSRLPSPGPRPSSSPLRLECRRRARGTVSAGASWPAMTTTSSCGKATTRCTPGWWTLAQALQTSKECKRAPWLGSAAGLARSGLSLRWPATDTGDLSPFLSISLYFSSSVRWAKRYMYVCVCVLALLGL